MLKPIPAVQSLPNKKGRLEFKAVSKSYRDGVETLSPIDFVCAPGEFIALVGPSGCGKSTLLGLAAGTVKPTQGQVLIDGKLVEAPGPDRAVIFQEHALFPWLNAQENVEFGLKMAGVASQERRLLAQEALEMVRMQGHATKRVHELSGGMRQRVAIARALVMKSNVMLMDEPFAALDAQTRTMLHEELQQILLKHPVTVIFVTHSVGEAVRLADRVVVMKAQPGRIRCEIPISMKHPRDFDDPAIAEIVHRVRKEIQDEVLQQQAFLKESA